MTAIGLSTVVGAITCFAGSLLTMGELLIHAALDRQPIGSMDLMVVMMIGMGSIGLSFLIVLPSAIVACGIQNQIFGIRGIDLIGSLLIGAMLGQPALLTFGRILGPVEGSETDIYILASLYGALACGLFWWMKRAFLSSSIEENHVGHL